MQPHFLNQVANILIRVTSNFKFKESENNFECLLPLLMSCCTTLISSLMRLHYCISFFLFSYSKIQNITSVFWLWYAENLEDCEVSFKLCPLLNLEWHLRASVKSRKYILLGMKSRLDNKIMIYSCFSYLKWKIAFENIVFIVRKLFYIRLGIRWFKNFISLLIFFYLLFYTSSDWVIIHASFLYKTRNRKTCWKYASI